jgi:peptide/nickel transport system substrate-binding protein
MRALKSVRTLLLPLVIIAALVASACGGGDDDEGATPAPQATPTRAATPAPSPTATPAAQPKMGGIIATSILRSFEPWDTYDRIGKFGVGWLQQMLSNLIYLDSADINTLVPDLAESWTVSQDGRTVTLRLRRGVLWHDGKPFTSADAQFNLMRAWKPPAPNIASNLIYMRFVENIQAPDAATVVITLKQASASFLKGLAAPPVLMYPAHMADVANVWRKSPVATGPFKYKSDQRDVSADLVKNETYYKKDEAGRPLPYLDGLKVFFIADPSAAAAAWRSKQTDVDALYGNLAFISQLEQLRREFPKATFAVRSPDRIGMFFNQTSPFSDKRVRQAISYGLDRRLLSNFVFGPIPGDFPSFYFLSEKYKGDWNLPDSEILQLPGYRQDRAADLAVTQRLFTEAQINPAQVKMRLVSITQYPALSEALNAEMTKLGFKPELRILGPADLTPALLRGDFDVGITGGGFVMDEPSDITLDLVVSNGPQNWGKWSNPKVDSLADAQERELDPAKRKQLLVDLQRELYDHSAFVPLVGIPAAVGAHEHVKGWTGGVMNVHSGQRWERVWRES